MTEGEGGPEEKPDRDHMYDPYTGDPLFPPDNTPTIPLTPDRILPPPLPDPGPPGPPVPPYPPDAPTWPDTPYVPTPPPPGDPSRN